MSSRYRLICMNHDPAIIVGDDLIVETAIRNFNTEDETIVDHEACDLMVGAFSYPLVQVGCLGKGMHNTGCQGDHANIIWHEVDWLSALAKSIGDAEDFRAIVATLGRKCLTAQRMARLRPLLLRR